MALAGPTIMAFGTPEQKARFIPRLLEPGAWWCQLYSEPGAGSDLASLQTRAERDGDNWRVNGQKIWTTFGHRAQYAILLARTDPAAPKHKGITYFIVDMKSPGITVRPLVNLADQHEFNEVFLEDVLIPNENIVGELNRGWYVGASTLNFERSNIGSAVELKRRIEDLAVFARTEGIVAHHPEVRHALADLAISVEVANLMSYRVISMQLRGAPPSHESSASKLFSSELQQRLAVVGMKIAGLSGQVMTGPRRLGPHGLRYLLSVQNTIAGGTSEIQRSLIANKGLGLPRD
jgi:alkylation response protein AidB-like acyl-CoA dehydrogenase